MAWIHRINTAGRASVSITMVVMLLFVFVVVDGFVMSQAHRM
jgi:hypothetical protein